LGRAEQLVGADAHSADTAGNRQRRCGADAQCLLRVYRVSHQSTRATASGNRQRRCGADAQCLQRGCQRGHLPHTPTSHTYLTQLLTHLPHAHLTHLPHTPTSHTYLTHLPRNCVKVQGPGAPLTHTDCCSWCVLFKFMPEVFTPWRHFTLLLYLLLVWWGVAWYGGINLAPFFITVIVSSLTAPVFMAALSLNLILILEVQERFNPPCL